VTKVRQICLDRDLSGWQSFLSRLELIRPAPELGSVVTPFQIEKEPLARIEWYTNQPPLSAEQPPAPDAPAVKWLLTQLTLMTAEMRMLGADDRFNWTFAEGLGLDEKYVSAEQRAEFELFVDRLFLCQRKIDSPIEYLWTPDGYTAFIANAELGDMLATEMKTRLLAQAASDLLASADNFERIYGGEIERVAHFLRLVYLSRLDLYYRVFAT